MTAPKRLRLGPVISTLALAMAACGGETPGSLAPAGPTGADAGAGATADPNETAGECVVELQRPDRMGTGIETESFPLRYEASTRRLTYPGRTYEFDDRDRVIKMMTTSPGEMGFSWTRSYDERNQVIRHETSQGDVVVYTNGYRGERLVSVRLFASAGPNSNPHPLDTRYTYEDPSSPLWTRAELDLLGDGPVDIVKIRILTGGLPTREEWRANGGATLDTVYSHQYEDRRIVTLERDRGYWPGQIADGKPDIRWSWSYDAAGRLRSFQQDGVDDLDNPHVDGKADRRQVFSAGCQPLITRFPWLAGLPGPEALGPSGPP